MSDDEKDEKDKLVQLLFGDERPMYTDKFGLPLTLMEWAKLMEDLEYRKVGHTEIGETIAHPPSRLSTVWLGLNHAFWPKSPPLTFETMRFSLIGEIKTSDILGTYTHYPILEFPDPEDAEYTDQIRYSTEEQARLGHARIVRLIQELEMQ